MGGAAPRLPPHAGECLRFAMAAWISRRVARAERAISKARDPAQQRKIPQCGSRALGNRARHAKARCRCRGRGTLEAFHDDHAPRRARYAENARRWRRRLIDRSKTKPIKKK